MVDNCLPDGPRVLDRPIVEFRVSEPIRDF